jgi:Arc/MetJ-type ribon-helix-helix transcriptional regulator
MTIDLTPEQERRIQAVMSRGAYNSVEEFVEAALAAVEQRALPGFAGTAEELDALLAEGLASRQLTETEFWDSVNKQTDAAVASYKTSSHQLPFVAQSDNLRLIRGKPRLYSGICLIVFFAAGFFFNRSRTDATIIGNPTVASTKTSPNFPPSDGGTNFPHEMASL